MAIALPCLLLPVSENHLLLPTAAVAEVLAYEEPKPVVEGPKWLLGILSWRGIHIPLTYLENMESHLTWNFSDQHFEHAGSTKRCVAVINRSAKIPGESKQDRSDRYPFFAIVLENSPRLKHIVEEQVKIITQFTEKNRRFLMEIKVENDSALIPNLEGLWMMIDALPSRLQWFRQIII
jgi:chemotaxis signal transduction protein